MQITTREKVLDTAQSMFNERGVEYVGIREIATALDMRVGNLTYYFPTKDHLIATLARRLRELNNQTVVVKDGMTMLEFLEMNRKVFQNQSQHVYLFKSFVHLFEKHEEIATSYKRTEKARFNVLRKILDELAENKFLLQLGNEQLEFLKYSISFINRFWQSEAAITFRNLSLKKQQYHYLEMIGRLLVPYSTAKGKKEIEKFICTLK
ncbi:MAG: TetR/AcrR family transcriptional regulator [Flavobacteriales bacterium]|nr:TetR/AcrR family transcriptional regulator [Flavobacteriales bacterium]